MSKLNAKSGVALFGCVSLVLSAVAASPAGASVASTTSSPGAFTISYQVNLPNYAVTDIAMFEQILGPNGLQGWGITTEGPPFTAGVGTTTLTDPFTKYQYIANNFLLGVATGLPGDASDSQQHLVVFTNDAYAAGAQNIAFGTLFTNTNEATLINDLVTGNNIGDLFNFAYGDATNGPNGADITFGSHDAFTAIAFSNGQAIGTGYAFTTGVPEPATWAMLILGLAGVGAALRRRAAPLAA